MVCSSLASQQRPGADRAAHPQPVPRALEFWIVWPEHVSVPFDSVENPGEARHIGVARQTTAQARHLIENFFARLKQYRAIATRYDKTARNFLGAIYLAGAMVSLN